MMRWMSSSSSTESTRGRATLSGALFGGSTDPRRASEVLRSKSEGGASSQNFSLYGGGALQKQVKQFVQTSVFSLVRQLHQSASAASKVTRQEKHGTSYPGSARCAGFNSCGFAT